MYIVAYSVMQVPYVCIFDAADCKIVSEGGRVYTLSANFCTAQGK